METRIKSIWTGSITFGLINIPVKVFSAVKESNLEMNMLDKNDYSNIKFKRVNENTGKEVTYADIVKGYKLDDQYVVVEDSDFEAAEAEKTKTIEIMNFVDEKEIDTIYYEQPYYLEPDKGAMKAYALLRDALQTSGKVGVGSIVLRNKESLVILKSYKNVIVLNRIRFQEEIRNTTELKLPYRALALQSLGKLGNDRVYARFSQREEVQGLPTTGKPGFFRIMDAVAALESVGFGFGKPGSAPGTAYNYDEVAARTPSDPDVNTIAIA